MWNVSIEKKNQNLNVTFFSHNPKRKLLKKISNTGIWLSSERIYKTWQRFCDLPCPAERSHGDRWDCTESASASESYPETQQDLRGEEKHKAEVHKP